VRATAARDGITIAPMQHGRDRASGLPDAAKKADTSCAALMEKRVARDSAMQRARPTASPANPD
jgi:hypothetical protein